MADEGPHAEPGVDPEQAEADAEWEGVPEPIPNREDLIDEVKSTLVNMNIAKNVLDATKPGPQLEGNVLEYLRARVLHEAACGAGIGGLQVFEEGDLDET